MNVLLNGVPMLGRLTGVGQYVDALMRALVRQPGIDRLEVFDGQNVADARAFLSQAQTPGKVARRERWKRLAGLLPGARRCVELRRKLHLIRQASRPRWDLYHETNYAPVSFRLPLVTTIHDMCYARYPRFLPHDRLSWLRHRLPRALSSSLAILADSEFTRSEILQLHPNVDPRAVFVARLAVDVERFSPQAAGRRTDEVRKTYSLPPRFLLCMGTLEPRKNVHGLLQAFRLLRRELQEECPLILAGPLGWNQHYFYDLLRNLEGKGRVRRIGYVAQNDVPAVMAAATVFCFPSFYEGFGLPPLEAAACGAPVLCSRTSSLPEVMGDAAWFVQPDSPEDIAHGLTRLLEDSSLRDRLSSAGPAQAARFHWDACASSTLAAYCSAA